MMQTVVIDYANSAYKATLAGGDKVHIIPARVSRTEPTRMYGVSTKKNDMVSFGDGDTEVTAYVGAGDVSRSDFDLLTGTWEQSACTYAAFAKLLNAGAHEVQLLAAVPVQVLMGNGARAFVAAFNRFAIGEHNFVVNKKVYSVTITQTLVRPQPMGAFYEWGLSDDGEWKREEPISLRYAVIDPGFNTLDLTVVENGIPVPEKTAGAQLGTSWLCDKIVKALSIEGIEISIIDADNLLLSYERSGICYTTSGFDATDIVTSSIPEWQAEVQAFISRTWRRDHSAAVTLLTGGGAPLVRSIASTYRNPVMLKEPVTANARGFGKYTLREVW
jgi:hypothetical protein